jgi:hypothetical protein
MTEFIAPPKIGYNAHPNSEGEVENIVNMSVVQNILNGF